ncbi:MAG: hypothetical protein BGO16_15060 [Nitrobacter sp. 62-23]|nr:MAG: hypothetical protein BGO16_15060 [Nitrobacter sp. 62-23]
MDSAFGAIGVFTLCFVLSALCATVLAEPGDRKVSAQFVLAGLFMACLKIWLIRQTPQWLDTPLDAVKYQLNAEALTAHWHGEAVNSQLYRLDGLTKIFGQDHWSLDAYLPYSSVFGTHEWLYAAYLAVWAHITPHWPVWATYSNAALAALFPAVSFGIARELGSTTRIAALGGTVALIDPSAAVNGAWLLKDTLACWCVLIAIWAALVILRKPRFMLVLLLGSALGILGSVRFLGLMAVLLAILVLLPALLVRRRILTSGSLLVACLYGLSLFSTLNSLPVEGVGSVLERPVVALKAILFGQVETLSVSRRADMASSAIDDTVVDWYTRLSESPLKASATAASRTLFAPYPWVIITEGLNFRNGIELYYLGIVLWIICLPGIFWAIVQALRNPSFPAAFVGLVLGACLGAYVIFYGEWSTRQRVFMLPVFFALAAIGWVDLVQRLGFWKDPAASGGCADKSNPRLTRRS